MRSLYIHWLINHLRIAMQLLSISFLCFKYMGHTWPSNRPGGSGTVYVLVLCGETTNNSTMNRQILIPNFSLWLIYRVTSPTFFFSCTPRMEWSHSSSCQRFQSEVCKAKFKAEKADNKPSRLKSTKMPKKCKPTCNYRAESPPQWVCGAFSHDQTRRLRATGSRHESEQTSLGSQASLLQCSPWPPCPGLWSLHRGDRQTDSTSHKPW